jgi:hypothetical protein
MATFYTDTTASVAGQSLYVTSANLSATRDYQAVRAIGYKGVLGMVPSGPPGGSASFDFTGGGPSQASVNIEAPVDVDIGGAGGDAYIESMSVTVEPNQVSSGSMGFVFFEPPSTVAVGGGGAVSNKGSTIFDGGHGAGSSITGTAAGQRAEYSYNGSWDAIYKIGSFCPVFKYRQEASESLSVEGDGISIGIDSCDTNCPGAETLTFTLGSLCDGNKQTYTVTGFATEMSVSVSTDGILSGNASVTKWLA